MTRIFGHVSEDSLDGLKTSLHLSGVIYGALFDRQSLWDPATIEAVIKSFPPGHVDEANLFLVLAECIANAVLHGQAEILGFFARRRGPMVLLTFAQVPPMQTRVRQVLSMAKAGQIRECGLEVPGGLGFPILLKITRKISISPDNTKMHLWLKSEEESIAA